MNNEQTRADFEQLILAHGGSIDRVEPGEYRNAPTESAWFGYQAATLKANQWRPIVMTNTKANEMKTEQELFEAWYYSHKPWPSPYEAAKAGWKLVPVEPTQEMLADTYGLGEKECARLYKTMLSAAPYMPPKEGV